MRLKGKDYKSSQTYWTILRTKNKYRNRKTTQRIEYVLSFELFVHEFTEQSFQSNMLLTSTRNCHSDNNRVYYNLLVISIYPTTLSKAELARKAGVSVLTITRIEQGMGCRMDTMRKVIQALGLKITDKERVFSGI